MPYIGGRGGQGAYQQKKKEDEPMVQGQLIGDSGAGGGLNSGFGGAFGSIPNAATSGVASAVPITGGSPDQDKKKGFQRSQETGGGSQAITGGMQSGPQTQLQPVAQSGMGGAQAPAGPSGRQARQGGFVGINRYLNAQQGAGGRMADVIARGVEERGAQAQAGIGQLQQSFKTQSDQDLGARQSALAALKKDPMQFSESQAGQLMSAYGGPQSLADVEGYAKTAEGVRQLGQQLGQTETGAGRALLSRDALGGANYTGGMSRLDSALLGTSAGAQDRFAGLRKAMGGTEDQILGAEKGAMEEAARKQTLATALQNRAKEQITGQREALGSAISGEQSAQTAAAQKEFEEVKEYLGPSPFSGNDDRPDATAWRAKRADVLRKLGMSEQEASGLQNAGGASQYLAGPSEITMSQVASDEQRAKDAALAKLAGIMGMGDDSTRLVSDVAGAGPTGVQYKKGEATQKLAQLQAERDRAYAERQAAKATKDAEEAARLAQAQADADAKARAAQQGKFVEDASKQAKKGGGVLGGLSGIQPLTKPKKPKALNLPW